MDHIERNAILIASEVIHCASNDRIISKLAKLESRIPRRSPTRCLFALDASPTNSLPAPLMSMRCHALEIAPWEDLGMQRAWQARLTGCIRSRAAAAGDCRRCVSRRAEVNNGKVMRHAFIDTRRSLCKRMTGFLRQRAPFA